MLGCFLSQSAQATEANASFRTGIEAYRAGEFARAAGAFRESLEQQTASGTLVNLGLSEWHRGRSGPAVLAWEQALWMDPYNSDARNNLHFARLVAQIESPELRWNEAASKWLPANVWAWIVGGSLWLVVGMIVLPQVLRWRKARWQQAVAALGLSILLLSIPAYIGISTRSQLGFALEKSTPLLLTPTHDAESIALLAAGEPTRAVRTRGEFVFIRTQHGSGWLKREQFGFVCPDAE